VNPSLATRTRKNVSELPLPPRDETGKSEDCSHALSSTSATAPSVQREPTGNFTEIGPKTIVMIEAHEVIGKLAAASSHERPQINPGSRVHSAKQRRLATKFVRGIRMPMPVAYCFQGSAQLRLLQDDIGFGKAFIGQLAFDSYTVDMAA
jgi:hypothetical protein